MKATLTLKSLALLLLLVPGCGPNDASDTASINPRVIRKYQAQVTIGNANGGNFAMLMGVLGGWNCNTSTEATYTEKMLDSNGQPVAVTMNSRSNFSANTLWLGRPTADIAFERNTINTEPLLSVLVRESCSRTVTNYVPRTVPDGRGGTTVELQRESDTETIYINWRCSFSNFPINIGSPERRSCTPSKSSYGSWSNQAVLQSYFLRDAVSVDLNMRLTESNERYFFNNCGNRRNEAQLIRLVQGVRGHVGENDFVFKVSLNDEQNFEIHTASGLIAEDILYCDDQNRDKINLKVSAVERDLFFDDLYVPERSQGIDIDTKNPDYTQTITLNRRTYFGNLFTPQVSNLKVEATLIKIPK